MRNLKRVLSLALALVMVLGMMVIGTSAATYTDAAEITYTEAVDVMTGVGLYKGNPDGSLAPKEVLTRGMAATIITRIMLGDKMAAALEPTHQIFSDVAVTDWYAAAVEYCYNIGMIDGCGDGTFNPGGELTGTAFAKLLLVAMGYDADAEGYTGGKWESNINIDAMNNGLYIDGVSISAKLTREGAAQMILQAMDAKMVEYTTSFDKATNAYVLYGPTKLAKTFQKTYFKNLELVEGVIEAVDSKGTVLGTTKVTATNVDWTDIGYAAYNWVVNGGKENVRTKTSVSDVIITGKSLGTSTNGVANSVLTAEKLNNKANPLFLAAVDTEECAVYYNGEYVGAYGSTKANTALAAAAKVGAKIDYVDNDNQGKAEAVIVTEYTFTTVKGVVKKSVSGVVSDYQYKLANDVTIEAKYLAGVDALVRGDFITYVKYDDTYYVNVLDVAMMELNSITRDKLNNETTTIYELDGEEYVASELTAASVNLTRADIKEDIVVVLDEYGYIVYASKYVDPAAYLYVLGNNHTDYLEGTTKTAVVFADGTSDYIYVSKVGQVTDFNNGAIDKGIYSYTLDKDGNYVLTFESDTVVTDADYETLDLYFDSIAMKYTTIVDLRKDTFGNVYEGYAEMPNLVNASVVYYEDEYTQLGYLLAGTDPLDLKAEFVVFDTTINVEEIVGYKPDRTPIYTYTLEEGVLVRGQLVTNYVLSEAQKNDIVANGVGAYAWDKAGKLTFTSFTKDTITWTPEDWGTLIDDNKIVTDDYTVIILNLTKGEIGTWDELVVEGDYYCYIDASVKTDKIMYIVGDNAVDSLANIKTLVKAYVDATSWPAAEKAIANAVVAAETDATLTYDALLAKAKAAVVEYRANAASIAEVKDLTELGAAIADTDVKTIVLTDDLVVTSTINLGGKNLDGKGHVIMAPYDLATDAGTDAIVTTGGKISNLTIIGGHRGIEVTTMASDLVLENVEIKGAVRAFHVEVSSATTLYEVKATNCSFSGKLSFAGSTISKATFNNCEFVVMGGTAKGDVIDFWASATFVGCDFETGFEFNFDDLRDKSINGVIALDDCTVDGGAKFDATYGITTNNFAFGV